MEENYTTSLDASEVRLGMSALIPFGMIGRVTEVNDERVTVKVKEVEFEYDCEYLRFLSPLLNEMEMS